MALTPEEQVQQAQLISAAAFGANLGSHESYFAEAAETGIYLVGGGDNRQEIHLALGLEEPLTGAAAVAAVLDYEFQHLVNLGKVANPTDAEFAALVAERLGADNGDSLAEALAGGATRADALADFALAQAATEGFEAPALTKTLDEVVQEINDNAPEEPEVPGVKGEDFFLTEGRDNLTGTDKDDTFEAYVGQNQNGAVTNELATGDRLDGGAGWDTLKATMINDSVVDDGLSFAPRPITKNIQEVRIEALDGVRLDATRMENVKEYWSDFSRDDLTVNNVNLQGNNLTITKDVTFGLKDAQTDVGLKAWFDSQSLKNEGTSKSNSSMLIRAADASTETLNAPLSNVRLEVGFELGDNKVTIQVESTDGTYAGLRTAIQTALQEKGHGNLSVTLGDTYNTVDFAGNNTRIPFTAQEILVSDPAGKEFTNVTFQASNINPVDNGFLLAGNASPQDPTSSSSFIETNLILDNAGRGSTAGDVFIGGMSNSGTLIDKVNVTVDRDSKINELLTGTGSQPTAAFKHIEVDSGANKGDLVINNIGNANSFNSTDFEGANLEVTGVAYVSGAYAYTTSSSNDTVNVTYNTESAASSNFSLSINTGSGEDVVTLNTFAGTTSAQVNHFEQNNVNINTGSGNDKIFVGDNGSKANIDAGVGDDFIQVSDSTDLNTAQWIFNANPSATSGSPIGQGNQTFQVFKTKLQVEFQGITSELIEVNYNNFVTTSQDINEAIKKAINEDPQLNLLLKASDVRNEGLQVDSLVHRALTADKLKINFVAPTYAENNNHNQSAAAFTQEAAEFFAGRLLVSEQEMKDAWAAYYPDSEGIAGSSGTGIYAGTNDANAMFDAMFGALDYSNGNLTNYNSYQTQGGANSGEETQNIINGGAGNDVIVLSSNWTSNVAFDVIKFEGNFGNDTVMNFNTGTAAGAGVADQLDFTSYLDQDAVARGTSNIADNRIDQQVNYSFANGLANAANLTGGINHNAVVMVGLSQVFANFNANDADNPTSFGAINTGMVERALLANQNWVNDSGALNEKMVGSTFVLRLAEDRQIETNATGEATNALLQAIAPQKEIVYTVTLGWNKDGNNGAGEYTFSAVERGTIEYGDMFSDLSNVGPESIAGTVQAVAAQKAAQKGEDKPDPTDPTDPTTPETNSVVINIANDVADVAGTDAADTFTVAAGQTFGEATTVNITNFGAGDKIDLSGAYEGGFDLGFLEGLDQPGSVSIEQLNGVDTLELNLLHVTGTVVAPEMDAWTVNIQGEAITQEIIDLVNGDDLAASIAGLEEAFGADWLII